MGKKKASLPSVPRARAVAAGVGSPSPRVRAVTAECGCGVERPVFANMGKKSDIAAERAPGAENASERLRKPDFAYKAGGYG